MKKSRKIILGIIVGVFIIMQFFRIDKTNPPINERISFQQIEQPPANISTLLKKSCYDCHSHQSTYPWYSNVAPVSFMLRSHIKGGRMHLNFSEWGNYPAEEREDLLKEAAEEMEDNNMPLKSYLWMHGEAKLTAAEKTTLINWLKGR